MDKFREFLVSLLGQEVVDGLTEEQVQSAESFIEGYIAKEEVKTAFVEGWRQEDGSIDLEKVTDPELKEVIESFTTDITTARGDAETARADATKTIRDFKVKEVVGGYGAVDIEDILKFIDLDKVVLSENGELEGLKELLDNLKKSKPHLFVTDNIVPPASGSGGFNPHTEDKKKLVDYKNVSWENAYLESLKQ